MYDNIAPVIEKVDLCIAEFAALSALGPNFRIFHRFHVPGESCLPGEEICKVSLVKNAWEYPLSLSLALRLFFDYLARHRHIGQTATMIEAGITREPFYIRHGMNATTGSFRRRKLSRASVKTYVGRLREAFSKNFLEAGVKVSPDAVLISERTDSNSVLYRLKANVKWVHIDDA